MATTALLVERTESKFVAERQSWTDWEAPAGGIPALPRIRGLSFTYRGRSDDHLCGQGCLALEPFHSATEACLVAFACGCRAHVRRSELVPR